MWVLRGLGVSENKATGEICHLVQLLYHCKRFRVGRVALSITSFKMRRDALARSHQRNHDFFFRQRFAFGTPEYMYQCSNPALVTVSFNFHWIKCIVRLNHTTSLSVSNWFYVNDVTVSVEVDPQVFFFWSIRSVMCLYLLSKSPQSPQWSGIAKCHQPTPVPEAWSTKYWSLHAVRNSAD